LPALSKDKKVSVSGTRLRAVLKRFFRQVAQELYATDPGAAHKFEQASPHWLRHTHATRALAHGVELRSVRDNLRHASITTTSKYVHGDELLRMKQLSAAFAAD
jgi:site-specific recombinase XerD